MAGSGRAAACVVVFAGVAVAAGGALAHGDVMPKDAGPATRAAYARHENYERLGKAFKAINDELKQRAPDKAAIAANAATMASLATAMPSWFPRGSGVEARPMSHAKANIWTDAAGFSAAASRLQGEVAKLNRAAAAGDIAAVGAQARATGAACKACHDKYFQEKKG